MARIEGVPPDRAGFVARLAYWFSRRLVGKVTSPLAVVAHDRPILQAYCGYEYFLGKARRVDRRLKTLASLKAASMVGCPF